MTKIIVCIDPSPYANTAFEHAIKFKKEDDELLLVHGVELRPPVYTAYAPPIVFTEHNKDLTLQGKRLLASYKKRCKEMGITNVEALVVTTRSETPADAILRIASGQDIMFVGTRGMGAWKRFFMGSFANYMVNKAECDVMVIKSDEELEDFAHHKDIDDHVDHVKHVEDATPESTDAAAHKAAQTVQKPLTEGTPKVILGEAK